MRFSAWIQASEFAFADRVLEELAAPVTPKAPAPVKSKVKVAPIVEEPAPKRERPMRRPEPICGSSAQLARCVCR